MLTGSTGFALSTNTVRCRGRHGNLEASLGWAHSHLLAHTIRYGRSGLNLILVRFARSILGTNSVFHGGKSRDFVLVVLASRCLAAHGKIVIPLDILKVARGTLLTETR
jgi:hypothetical protein